VRIFSLCSLRCHFLRPRQKLLFAEFDSDCFTRTDFQKNPMLTHNAVPASLAECGNLLKNPTN